MNINDAASPQTVSPKVVPAANHDRRKTEVVRDGLDGVPVAHLIAGRMPSVTGAVFGGRMLAWRDRDNQLAVGLKVIATRKVVFLLNRFWTGPVGTGDRCESVAFSHRVVPPPFPHRRRDGLNCRQIAIPGSGRKM